jgi:hypothetical protein
MAQKASEKNEPFPMSQTAAPLRIYVFSKRQWLGLIYPRVGLKRVSINPLCFQIYFEPPVDDRHLV